MTPGNGTVIRTRNLEVARAGAQRLGFRLRAAGPYGHPNHNPLWIGASGPCGHSILQDALPIPTYRVRNRGGNG